MIRHVVIVGSMGVGKSTLADGLAAALGRPHLDSDVSIEDDTGRTARAIAAQDGIEALHALEVATLLGHLATDEPVVVSAAASVVDARAARAALRSPTVLWLDLPVEALHERIRSGDHRRPIAPEVLAELDARRRPHLEALADHRLDAALSPDELVTMATDLIDGSGTLDG